MGAIEAVSEYSTELGDMVEMIPEGDAKSELDTCGKTPDAEIGSPVDVIKIDPGDETN